MLPSDFFIQIVLILISARLLGEIAARFGIPSVLGELLAGVILGPSVLNWVELNSTIKLLSEIGVVLLLFEVGINTDLSKLIKAGGKATISALGGVLTPLILGFLASFYIFKLDLLTSLFIGGTLTATSTGITLRVLSDFKRSSSHESQIILGAAILDDIIGILLLSLLFEFSRSGKIDIGDVGKVVILVILFLLLTPIIVKLISIIIKKYQEISEIPGLLPTTIVSIILFFSWLAKKFGAPELLGGFAAGLALSRRFFLPFEARNTKHLHFSDRVDNKLKPIIHLFVPFFFVAVGLELNLKAIDWNSSMVWITGISLLVAAVIGKLAAGFVLPKESFFIRMAVGLAMIPRGEMGLIFAEFGRLSGLFDTQLYATLILVIAITTLFTPFVMRTFYKSYGYGK